jgi:arylsulfatase A
LILDALKRHGFADNTLVVFTSDNGNIRLAGMEVAGFHTNGKLIGSKADAWEGGHRVPFIVRWPGRIPEGVTTDRLLSTVDLYDTFLAAAGIAKPEGAGVDSMNQLPLLEDPAHHPPIRQAMTYKGKGSALRVGHWLYQHYQGPGGLFSENAPIPYGYVHSDYVNNVIRPDAPPGQLYDLREDLSQAVNLYGQRPDLVQSLENLRVEVSKEWNLKKPLSGYLSMFDEPTKKALGLE